jgi:hypothetical protein
VPILTKNSERVEQAVALRLNLNSVFQGKSGYSGIEFRGMSGPNGWT